MKKSQQGSRTVELIKQAPEKSQHDDGLPTEPSSEKESQHDQHSEEKRQADKQSASGELRLSVE